jgi:NitT/TauT family transport system ATP-binding protein
VIDRPARRSSPPAAAGIALRHVSKRFTAAQDAVLNDVSLDIAPGEFVTVLGPTGCGKTTLLRLINGLLPPDAGSILVNGAPPRPGPDMGFVFQSFRLIPWATSARNVSFGLELAGVSQDECDAASARYLDRVGLTRYARAYPRELSGGMKQRVALARAFATEPSILLMDEPFASLDAQTREIMQLDLLALWSERQASVVFVTHSVEEAILLGDRTVVMGAAPNSIREIVPIDLPRPRLDEVRTSPRFLDLRNYLTGVIRALITADPNSPFFGRR